MLFIPHPVRVHPLRVLRRLPILVIVEREALRVPGRRRGQRQVNDTTVKVDRRKLLTHHRKVQLGGDLLVFLEENIQENIINVSKT